MVFITSFRLLDYSFFMLFTRLLSNPSFWLTLLLLIVIVNAKDIYIAGLERNFNFKPEHIIQEIEARLDKGTVVPNSKEDMSDLLHAPTRDADEARDDIELMGKKDSPMAISSSYNSMKSPSPAGSRSGTPKGKKRGDVYGSPRGNSNGIS